MLLKDITCKRVRQSHLEGGRRDKRESSYIATRVNGWDDS